MTFRRKSAANTREPRHSPNKNPRDAAFQKYYDTLIASGCTDLSMETYRNDIRLGTIAELISCLQQEDRPQWADLLWDYYKTIVELSTA